jgi:hypothetical protein
MPPDTTLLARMNQSELAESILGPVINQLGLMQQQMFDQFQQAMVMVVQMFGTMHRDQMAVIREELDRLHALSKELHGLKNELASQSRNRVQTVPGQLAGDPAELGRAAATVPEVSAAAPAAQMVASRPAAAGEPSIGLRSELFNGLKGVQFDRPPAPASPVSPAASSPEQPSLEPGLSPSTPPLSNPFATLRGEQPQPDPPSQTKSGTAANGPSAGSDRDAIVWLHQRIMSIQRERESRWQKILKLLPKVS